MSSYDLTIIGAGPGGYVAAIKAAQMGKKVAIIEKEAIGGVCLNWGCIPTKSLLKSAKVYEYFTHAKSYGITVDIANVSIDFPAIIKRKNIIVKKLTSGIAFLLKKNGVDVYQGFAEALDAHTVKVGEETLTTKKLILATGASPMLPPIEGLKESFEKGFVVSSKEALDLSEQPKALTIIGGGVIGVEFATIFNTLGTKVTILERESDILLGVDQEIKEIFKKKIKKDGVTILTGANVSKVTDGTVTYTLEGKEESLKADKVLLSAGMKPNLKGLEKLNLKQSKFGIETDEYLRTSIKDVYAIGDLNGKYMLAHVASKEGIVAVEHMFGHPVIPMNYLLMPSGIYTFPEIAQVGLTEEMAKEKNIAYKVSTFPLSANGKALAEGEKEGLVKIIAEPDLKQILGVHILAPSATELISEGVLGMNLEMTAFDLAETVHPHPTLSEMIHEVAHGIIDKPIHI